MKRRYYLSSDLDELDRFEASLLEAGLGKSQMYVLSRDDAGVSLPSHLTAVEAVLKKDVVHGTEVGAVIGITGAALVLGVAWFSGVTASVGWVPFLFLAIIVLGFCTWEGGLFGIQEAHREFANFDEELEKGNHLMLIDVAARELEALDRIQAHFPGIHAAGEGSARPDLLVHAHKKFDNAMQTLP